MVQVVAEQARSSWRLVQRFQPVAPLLMEYDPETLEGATVYRVTDGRRRVGAAVVRPRLPLDVALDVPSCGVFEVDLLEAIVILPGSRGRGVGRAAVLELLRLHPRLVCVSSRDSMDFWRALSPSMVEHPIDAGRFVSGEVLAHIQRCPMCG